MNEIVKIYKDNQVRIIQRDGEPWFVAVDVCRVLDIANPRNAVARLDEDEKTTVQITDGRKNGARMLNIISESGFYSLISRSNKAEAKAFKRWVTHDVLPSIRKTGAYAVPGINVEALCKMVLAIKQHYETLVEENAKLRQRMRYALQFLPKTKYGAKSKRNGQRQTTIRRGANVAGNGRLLEYRDPDEVGYEVDLFQDYLPEMLLAETVNIINVNCPKL